MNISPHTQSSQQFYPQNIDRKRTTSMMGQLSSASRQNLQVSNRQNILNQHQGYQKIDKFPSNQYISDNYPKTDAYGYSQRIQQHEVSKLKTQNMGLQQQLQRQKQKYQLQISQLRRNLTLKDELLDQCEKQIVNLKSTYIKLIDQYEQFRGTEETQRRTDRELVDYRQKGGIVPKSPEGSFIPLSIKTKGKVVGEVGKLSHGLIKGRV